MKRTITLILKLGAISTDMVTAPDHDHSNSRVVLLTVVTLIDLRSKILFRSL